MKRIYLYLVILAVLLTAAYYLATRKGGSTIARNLKSFSVEDTASLTKIFIADKTGKSVLLEKQANKTWTVNTNFQARPDMIETLLSTLKRVEVKSPVNKPMRQRIMNEMATSATKVEIYKNNSKQKTFYVGGPTQDGLGTFMLLEGADEAFITHIPGFEGYLSTRFATIEDVWKDREVFRFHPALIDIIKVEYPGQPKNSFTLKIQDQQTITLKNDAGDEAKSVNGDFLRQYLKFYEDIQFESLIKLRPGQQDSVLYPGNLICEITVYDKSGTKKSAKLYRRYYNGLDFAQSGNEAEYDHSRYFVLTPKNGVANAQRRIFEKIMVKYGDFFGEPIEYRD